MPLVLRNIKRYINFNFIIKLRRSRAKFIHLYNPLQTKIGTLAHEHYYDFSTYSFKYFKALISLWQRLKNIFKIVKMRQ